VWNCRSLALWRRGSRRGSSRGWWEWALQCRESPHRPKVSCSHSPRLGLVHGPFDLLLPHRALPSPVRTGRCSAGRNAVTVRLFAPSTKAERGWRPVRGILPVARPRKYEVLPVARPRKYEGRFCHCAKCWTGRSHHELSALATSNTS